MPRQTLLKRLGEIKRDERQSQPRLGKYLIHPQDPTVQPRPRQARRKPYQRPRAPDRSTIPLPSRIEMRDNIYMAAHPLPPRPAPTPRRQTFEDLLRTLSLDPLDPMSPQNFRNGMKVTEVPEGLDFKNEFKE